MIRKAILLVSAAALVSGCSYGFRGPQPIIGASGPVFNDHSNQQRYGVFFERFRALAYRAAGCTEIASPVPPAQAASARVRCDDVPPADAELLRRYMRAGFALVYADCDQYMAVMARHQGRTRIGRDLITPLTTFVTGMLALSNLGDGDRQDLLRGFNLFSSASSAGLDIIDQRFLFGADNIDVVRGRVTASLGAHADAAVLRPDNEINFERASSEILNNQALCTPSGILRLTRNAIQTAPATASNSSNSKPEATPPSSRAGISATTVDP